MSVVGVAGEDSASSEAAAAAAEPVFASAAPVDFESKKVAGCRFAKSLVPVVPMMALALLAAVPDYS